MSLRVYVAVAVCCSALACGGDDGEDGKNALTSVVPASAEECPAGGSTIQAGLDTNGNGQLDANEVTSTSSVCDGDDTGGPWLTASADADVATCPWGGTVLSFGKDTDKNDILAPTEVVSTRAVCNSTVLPSDYEATWTGEGDTNLWSNPRNWRAGEVPSPGSIIEFPLVALQKTNVNDLQRLFAVNRLVLEGGYTLSGNELIVLNNITGGIAPDELALPLRVRQFARIELGDVGPGRELLISGNIAGAFASTIEKAGAGELELSGDNSYTSLELGAGTVRWTGDRAHSDSGTLFGLTGTVIVDGEETIGDIIGGSAIVINGSLTSDQDVELRAYTGVMSGPGAFIKRGAGRLNLLAASNDHTGPLRIEEGTLAVLASYGASAATVSAGAVLAGNGNVGGISAVAGATLQAGEGVNPGNFTASGNTTLAAGSIFRVVLQGTVSGSQYSRLSVLGNVDITGASLAGSVGFAPTTGNFFDIIQCSGTITGTFDGHPNGSTVTLDGREFTISYLAQAVRLTKT